MVKFIYFVSGGPINEITSWRQNLSVLLNSRHYLSEIILTLPYCHIFTLWHTFYCPLILHNLVARAPRDQIRSNSCTWHGRPKIVTLRKNSQSVSNGIQCFKSKTGSICVTKGVSMKIYFTGLCSHREPLRYCPFLFSSKSPI